MRDIEPNPDSYSNQTSMMLLLDLVRDSFFLDILIRDVLVAKVLLADFGHHNSVGMADWKTLIEQATHHVKRHVSKEQG